VLVSVGDGTWMQVTRGYDNLVALTGYRQRAVDYRTPIFHEPSKQPLPHGYHMHSSISCDSTASMIEMAAGALHPTASPRSRSPNMMTCTPKIPVPGTTQPETYFANLEAARRALAAEGLTIRAGIELGEPHIYHAVQQPVLDQYPMISC